MATLFEPLKLQVFTAASAGKPLKATDPDGVFESELPVTVAVQVLAPSSQSTLDWVQPTPMVVAPVVPPDDVDDDEDDVDEEDDDVDDDDVLAVIVKVAIPC